MTLSFNKLNEIAALYENIAASEQEQLNEAPMTAFQAAGGNAKLAQLNKGRSPRGGIATASSIEKLGQDNLFKAGGGQAAIDKGPKQSAGRAGMRPALTRQDIINRGTTAKDTAKPAPKPAPTPTPAAKPALTPTRTPAPAARPSTPAPKAATPAPTPTSAKTSPTAAPARNGFGASTSSMAAKSSVSSATEPASAPAKRPSLAAQNAELRAMQASSRQRQGLTQSFDVFDAVLGYLIDEGYADTEEAATAIMANMSEGWRESIVENRGMAYSGGKPGASGDGGKPTGITGGTTYQMKGWNDDKDAKKPKVKGV